MDLIQKINKSHGLGKGDKKRSPDDPVVVLRGRLERACERLSRDLYNTNTHFLLEFIQNADDNEYEPHVVPNLQLRLHGDQLLIRCNEKGFRADNVEAICDVGHSTKKKQAGSEGYIGEKGIGFKAVFVVAKRVHVASREFTFRFDRDGPLGMINPIWDPSHPSEPGWTIFRLDISHPMEHAKKTGDLRDKILTIQPTLLLFLRRLRTIDVDVTAQTQVTQPTSGRTKITISRIDEANNVVRLECHEDGVRKSSSQHIVFKQTTPTFTGEEKRRGIQESEVILAFPVTTDGEPEIGNQFVHVYLPVSKYDLPFVVQADFLTPSSREGIITDSQWNSMLFEGIINTFLRAVQQFQQDPILRDCWVRYIPIHAQPPFTAVAEDIITRLQAQELLLCTDGRHRLPQDIVRLPKGFRTNRTEPLIPSQYLPSVHYLAESYDASRDRQYFTTLGVKPLSDQNILDGLTTMDRADVIRTQDDQWHNIICAYLNDMPRPGGSVNKQILDLRLLPMNDGTWHAAREAGQFVFMSDMDIVQDVELKCISSSVKENSARHTFFEMLGVRRTDITLIATRILLKNDKSASLSTSIRYARFFYENRNQRGLPQPSTKFKVMDENGLIAMGSEVYLEMPDWIPGYEFKLRDALPSDARFLHRDYVQLFPEDRYWLLWLQDTLGLHTSPRTIAGRLSPEFYSMARTLDTAQFLAALRAFWLPISSSISPLGFTELSNIEVACDDGNAYPLRTTSLKRQNISWLSPALSSCLRFIPVKDPDDSSWSFLARLDVTMEANAAAWISILFRLQETNCTDEETVISVYQQLNARFVEAADGIRASFYHNPLILAPPNGQNRPTASWVTTADVYWDGPSTIRSKFIARSTYPALEDFFCWKLGLQNAPIEALVDELSIFAAQHEASPLTEETVRTLEQMLIDISECIARNSVSQFCLLGLVDRSVFPVHIREEIRLQRIDQFFISEKGGKITERLRKTVPILAISSAQILYQLRPMLESNVWPNPPRVLETCLVLKPITLGTRTLDQEVTHLYSTRSEYMEKYVQHTTRYCPTTRQMEFLAKMRNTSIYVVDEVIVMWNLGGKTVSVQPDVKVAIEETEDRVDLYVSRSCAAMPRTRDREICSLLGDGDRVSIDKLALLQFVSMPWEDLLLYLEDEGVDISTCIPQTTQESTYEPEQPEQPEATETNRPTLPSPPPSTLPSPPPPILPSPLPPTLPSPPREPQAVEPAYTPAGEQRGSANNVRARSDKASLRPRAPPFHMDAPQPPAKEPKIEDKSEASRAQYTSPPRRPLNSNNSQRRWAADTLDHYVAQLEMASAATSLTFGTILPQPPAVHDQDPTANEPVSNDRLSSQHDDRDPANGVLGELFVFRMLQHDLGPDFTEDNWTSELRGQVPGFTPYSGPSTADFRYVDRDGRLTGLWYGQNQSKAWEGRWPTYHLEVKTTSGTVSEPFHMSAAQLQLAKHFSIAARASQGAPQDIYVIIRVSEVKSAQPKHYVYLDPHKSIYDGGLVIKCDVDLVPQ